MRDQWNDTMPREQQSIAEELRRGRHQASPLQLDRIKHRAMARASSRSAGNLYKGMFMRSKLLSIALAVGLLLCTASVGLAVTGNFPGSGSGSVAARGGSPSGGPNASAAQYGGTSECRLLRRDNREDEKRLISQNRADEREKGLSHRERASLRRRDRKEERQLRARNRRAEARCRRTGESG